MRSRHKPHIVALVYFALLLPYSVASPQECGDLPVTLCERVATAISKWNARFSDTARIQSWSHTQTARLNIDSLIAVLDEDNGNPLAVVDSAGNVRVEVIGDELREQWSDAERSHLFALIGDDVGDVSLVNLNWVIDEKRSNSVLVATNHFPYLHERTLSSVVVESRESSCENILLKWIWGSERGRILVDLKPYDNGAICMPKSRAMMQLGSAQVHMQEVEYGDTTCSSRYVWGYATPFASLSLDVGRFSFVIGGLGSTGTGNGDCVVYRQ